MSKKSKVFLLFAAAGMLMFAAALYFSRDTIRGILRQRQDEAVAEEYLKLFSVDVEERSPKETEESLISQEETEESLRATFSETSESTKVESTPAEEPDEEPLEETVKETISEPVFKEIIDEKYYERGGVVYTPDYAQGELDCVLEIPCISLKRGVYKGNAAQIDHDLSIWLTTAAKENMELGKTNYAIYGHNHPVQDLSFNRLKDVRVGDTFTLTKEDKVYVYRVTRIFAEWRSTGRKRYAMNTSLNPSLCYIFTCGRDYWPLNGVSTRYKDYIVEGTVEEVCSLEEWKDRRTTTVVTRIVDVKPKETKPEETKANEPKTTEEETESTSETETETRSLIEPILSVTDTSGAEDGAALCVKLTDPEGSMIPGAFIALLNDEGNEICTWLQEEPKELTVSEGTYVIAVLDLDREIYKEPAGKEIIVSSKEIQITNIGERTQEREVSGSQLLLMIAAFSAAYSVLFLSLFIISLFLGKKQR